MSTMSRLIPGLDHTPYFQLETRLSPAFLRARSCFSGDLLLSMVLVRRLAQDVLIREGLPKYPSLSRRSGGHS